jgi:hypothetical protein
MPRLIFKGNTINNFGRFLPAPYIDRIVLNDNSIDVTTSLVINAPTDDDDSTEIVDLINEDLHQNLVIMGDFGEDTYDTIDNFFDNKISLFDLFDGESSFIVNTVGTDPFDYFISWSSYYKEDKEAGFEGVPIYIIDYNPLDNDETTTEIIYDDKGNRFRKYSLIQSIETSEQVSEMVSAYNRIYVMAFTSKVDIGYGTNINDKEENLYKKEVSDISYEQIVEDNAIVESMQTAWLDRNENPFDGIPLQSITSQYHKSENITHQEIIDSLTELLSEYDKAIKVDTKLENAVDSISYVLSVYGSKPDLMPRLNLLRKMFSSKSTVNSVGRLYVRFRKRLYNFNRAVTQEGRLFRKLIINPKIVNNIETPYGSWEERTIETFGENEILYDDWLVGSSLLSHNSSEYDYINTTGFFFLDFEKLVYNCNAARFFDIAKLEEYFSTQVVNGSIEIGAVTLNRYSEEDELYMSMASHPLSTFPVTDYYEYSRPSGLGYGNPVLANPESPAGSGDWLYSFLMARSFNLANSSGLNGYRLVCYQFRDFYDRDTAGVGTEDDWYVSAALGGRDDQYYTAHAEITDNSTEVIKDIISAYQDAATSFNENYVELASESCNYNSADGKFNQFFIDGMDSLYGDNLGTTPWVVMPTMYNIYLDLLTNAFNGSRDDIIARSKIMSMKINPYTGTLEELEAFYNLVVSLYTDNFDGWDYDLDAISSGNADEPTLSIPKLLYQYDSEGNTSEYETTFTDFPQIYTGEVDISAYAEAATEAAEEEAEASVETVGYASFPWETTNLWAEYERRLAPDGGPRAVPAMGSYSELYDKLVGYGIDYYNAWRNEIYYNEETNYEGKADKAIELAESYFEEWLNNVRDKCAEGWSAVYDSYDGAAYWVAPAGSTTADYTIAVDGAGQARQYFVQWLYPNYNGSYSNTDTEDPSNTLEEGIIYEPSVARDWDDVFSYLLSYDWKYD